MSWVKPPISVSNPKRRMIDPSFWIDPTLQQLSIFEQHLFIGLFSNADDQGRVLGYAAVLKGRIYAYQGSITVEDIEAGVASLEKVGFLVSYTADNGHKYIQITGWWNDGPCQQKPQWAYPSDYPPPHGWKDRLRYRAANSVITDNWNGSDEDDGDFYGGNNGNSPPPSLGNSLPKETGNGMPMPIESESESVSESDSGLMGGDPPVRLLAREWEAQFGAGSITQTTGMQFDDWLAEFGLTETLAAIRATGDHSKRERVRWPAKYVDAVLKKGDAVHPAVKVWLEEARRPRPGASLEADIIKTVGETEANLELWRQIIHAYCGLGWNREAVLNQLDFFNRREVPARQQTGGTHGQSGQHTTGKIKALADKGKRIKRVADPATGESYWYDTRTRQRVEAPA